MLLTDKITTFDEYVAATYARRGETRQRPIGADYLAGDNFITPYPLTELISQPGTFLPVTKQVEQINKSLWWLHREMLRVVHVYPEHTAVMRQLNALHAFGHMMPHISADDPSMIAFTASADDGARDRQTRMALGRFIRRYYNFATDKNIAAIEAAHRGELNPPVEFIVAETDPKEFLNAYQAISSCMSKSTSSYGLKLMHPVLAYCTPGFQLAILKNAGGGISARSLVWINPDNKEDKRYVRTYGDVVLHNYLKKNGFMPRAFEPAYLKTMVIKGNADSGREQLVAPYVDSGSECPSGEGNQNGVWDGADRIYLLKSGTKTKIPPEFLVQMQTSGGHTYGRPFPINRKCALTGEPVNGLKDQFVSVWHDGKEDIALASAVKDWLFVAPSYGRNKLYFPPDTVTFLHGATRYVDNDENRQAMGYVRLMPKFYPDSIEWFSKNDKGLAKIVDGHIKAEDLMIWIDEYFTRVNIHKSQLPKDAVRVAALDDIKTWAHPTIPTVRTEANRKVVPGVHAVKQAYDGKWHYERQLHQVLLFGQQIWVPLDQSAASIDLTELPTQVKTSIAAACAATSLLVNAKKKALFDTFAARGDFLCPLSDHGDTYEAGYVFEYRSIPLKLVEAFLAADYVEGKVTKAPVASMKSLHKFGRMVIDIVNKEWALAHPKATAKEAATVD